MKLLTENISSIPFRIEYLELNAKTNKNTSPYISNYIKRNISFEHFDFKRLLKVTIRKEKYEN